MSTAKPLGYFYDFQNCPFPLNKSPAECVEAVRDKFGHLGSEKEFVVVCDVQKERPELIEALAYIPGLKVAHVGSSKKESADKELEIQLDRFVAAQKSGPGTIVLISSDEGFRAKINWLRRDLHYKVVLLHGNNISPDFLIYPNEHHNFLEILKDVPNAQMPAKLVKVNVTLTPTAAVQKMSKTDCERRLNEIFQCRSVTYNPTDMMASLLFNNTTEATKAREMEKEDVYGHSLKLTFLECQNNKENGNCPDGSNCQFDHFPKRKTLVVRPLAVANGNEITEVHQDPNNNAQPNVAPKLQQQNKKQEECKFHRTLGCTKAIGTCRFLHIPANKGADISLRNFGVRCKNPHLPGAINTPIARSYQCQPYQNFTAHTRGNPFGANPTIVGPERSTAYPNGQENANVAQNRSVFVERLKYGTTQADLDFIGTNRLAECGWCQSVLTTTNGGPIAAVFNFLTPIGAEKGKKKLIGLKNKELSKPSPTIFLKTTAIYYYSG